MPERTMLAPVIRQVANRFEYGSLVFWAEGGGIYLEDAVPETGGRERVAMTLPRWRERCLAIRDYIKAAEADGHVGTPQEIRVKAQNLFRYKALFGAMMSVGRAAVQQGDISSPTVQKHLRDHVAPVKLTYSVPAAILP